MSNNIATSRREQLETVKRALLAGATQVRRMFGRSLTDLKVEYKAEDGDTPRTLIDRESELQILGWVKRNEHFNDYNINSEEAGNVASGRKGTLWIDPFDGTSNAAIKLRMSTVGMCVSEPQAEGGEKVVLGIIVNPFDLVMVYAVRGEGVFRVDLKSETDGRLYESDDPVNLVAVKPTKPNERFAWVDGLFNANTSARKSAWIDDVSTLAQNMRMQGSNIDSSYRLATGGGHIQLTDAVGGFFDLTGIPIIAELGGRFMDLDGNEPTLRCEIAVACVDADLAERLLEITNAHYGKNSKLGLYKGFR